MTARARATADDPRFTFGLTYDVAEVLKKHGYEPIKTGAEFLRLQQALFRFLYRTDEDGAA